MPQVKVDPDHTSDPERMQDAERRLTEYQKEKAMGR